MIITNKINMDLQKPKSIPMVEAVQTDSYSRNLEFTLFDGGEPFRIPDNAAVMIRYRKFDGKGGEYDTLPNRTSAWSVQNNTLTVALAPQVLTTPGNVALSVTLICGNRQISTFPVQLEVHPVSRVQIAESTDYFYITGLVPAPSTAEVGKYLRVSSVTDEGRVTGVEAVDCNGGNADPQSIRQIVDQYWQEQSPVTQEDDPTVPNWAKQPTKPTYTANEVGADAQGTAVNAVNAHNEGGTSHADIRSQINQLSSEITDKAQISPAFANSIAECTDTTKLYVLPDGYIYAYMKFSGPAYTNQLAVAVDADGNVYNGIGYKGNVRLSASSGYAESAANGVYTTGFIPVSIGDVLRLQNITLPTDVNDYSSTIYVFDSDKNGLGTASYKYLSDRGCSPVLDDNGTLMAFTVASTILTSGFSGGFLRLGSSMIDSTSIITVNEEISEGDGYRWQSTGHAFVPADYEARILELESASEQADQVAANMEGRLTAAEKLLTSTLPEYVQAELATVRDALYTKTALGNTAIIGFSTDQHISKWADMQADTNTAGTLYGLQALRQLTGKLPFNLVAFGGDYNTGGSVESIQQEVLTVFEQLVGANCPVIGIIGNHDAWQNADCTNGDLFKSHTAPAVVNYPQFVNLSNEACNGYLDDRSVKIRFIFCDAEPHGGSDGTYYNLDDAKAALQTMLDGIPEGYKAVIFSHKPIHNGLGWKDGLGWQSMVEGFADKLICCINGHGHTDASSTTDGVLYIQTRSASPTDYEGNADLTAAGTAEETAFDVFVINQANSTIHAVRYGAGEDREFSY